MHFLFRKLFGNKDEPDQSDRHKLNAATAQNVLKFIAHGLTRGATSLRDHYQPPSKVTEFVAVSGQILNALKQHHDNRYNSDSVPLSIHINDQAKQVTMTQVGQNVMLVLDESSTLLTHTTLAELYIALRNDMAAHGEIYGEQLQWEAQAMPRQ